MDGARCGATRGASLQMKGLYPESTRKHCQFHSSQQVPFTRLDHHKYRVGSFHIPASNTFPRVSQRWDLKLCPIFHRHSHGWEHDPEEERSKSSKLGYFVPCTYSNHALFFQLDNAHRGRVVKAFKAGLEHTFSQARHLVRRIGEDAEGVHFMRRKGDTVDSQVQYLDSTEDGHP
jgi:hypothetical protein